MREKEARMARWNFVAMGQTGLTGWTAKAARPLATVIARRTGRSEAEILALIGTAFLTITLIDFLRTLDAVITAGRTGNGQDKGIPPATALLTQPGGDL
jgi:hypothetical protein